MAGRFNPDDYETVDQRIGRFYADHHDGRIVTELVARGDKDWLFKAYVYRDSEQVAPWATGYAQEIDGDGPVNRTSAAENCETSAIGRALANAGYSGSKHRPTREEMQKASRVDPAVTEAAAKDQAAAKQAKHENAAKLAAFEAAGMDKDEAKKLYAQALEAVGFDKVETAGQVKVVKQWLTDNMVQTVLDATEVKEET